MRLGATSIQDKMFPCTKKSSDRVKEKVHFRIQFRATQVPHLAWDRLAVFLIPLDTGRVSSKTCKVPVQNGQCHWPRAVSETAKLILDIRTLKYDEKLYRLVVGKGSRSDVLGEVIINLTEHTSAACPTSVSLPLRFCYAGTVLHESRPSEWQSSIFQQEGDEAGTPLLHQCRYNVKCNMRRHSSSSSSAMDEASRLQVPSCSPSSAICRIDKTKSGLIPISYLSLSFPATPARNDGYRRSFESFITSSALSSSTGSSFKGPAQDLQNGITADFEELEGALEETHNEAFPWKTYAQRLQVEIEMQEQQLAIAKLNVDIEQSSFIAESELEHVKFLKQENEHCRIIIEELKEELAFEKGANANLNIELQKLRDSNMDLHSAVRGLEDSLKMQIRQTQYVDSVEEERDAYLLESCVFENLVRELCDQLQTVHKARDEDDIKLQGPQTQNECERKKEQGQDFICDAKDQRASFSDVLKTKQESEGQLQSTYNSLEDRMMTEHGELMSTISSMGAELKQLSRESDRMLNKCDLSKIKQEQNDQNIQGSLRLSIEEKACEILYLRDEVHRLQEQNTTLMQKNETLALKAMLETERHQAEKKEWNDKFIEMEVRLKRSEAEISSAKTAELQEVALQCRASDANELETALRSDVVTRERERHTEKDEAAAYLFWKTEKQKLLDEILRKSAEVEILKTEVVNFMGNLKNEKIRLDIGLQKLNADRAKPQEANSALEQKNLTLEAELENYKILKATLEEQVVCLQTKLQVECVLRAEARNDCKQLRKENQDLKCQLFESHFAKGNDRSKLEGDLLNLQKRMEAELDSLVHAESQLLEKLECLEVAYEQSEEHKWDFFHVILGELEQSKHAESATQENVQGSLEAEVKTSKLAIVTLEENISRLQSQLQLETEGLERAIFYGNEQVDNLARNLELLEAELCDVRDMAAYKEEDVRSKELESIKQEFQDREALLWKRIEFLEMANEQLAEHSGGEQLKKELTRLQTHNSELIRREDELMSKLRTYELLQLELQRLQEANEQLEQKLFNVKEDALVRLTYLEAESLDTNKMPKLQLQSILAKQHNVDAAALHILGDLDEIMSTMVCFKKQASCFEAELNKMQDMYLNMSMRLAEIQAEKEELILAVKALQSGQDRA